MSYYRGKGGGEERTGEVQTGGGGGPPCTVRMYTYVRRTLAQTLLHIRLFDEQ